MPRFLHVGCGRKRKADTVAGFASDWEEITLDIDEGVRPDIVDSLPELRAVAADSFDAVYSAHNVEHLYPHEVPAAFGAFQRVLKADGFAVVTCPDLQSLGERLAAGDLETPLYRSPAGPVAPIDILFGFRPSLQGGNLYMAHHTGFTISSLKSAFLQAGFVSFIGFRRMARHELWGLGTKTHRTEPELRELAARYLPAIDDVRFLRSEASQEA
jgi:Uncharacterized protein conserved in bacteria